MLSLDRAELADLSIPIGTGWLLGACMEARGKQDLWIRQKPEVLEVLREQAIIQSVESSNRIEGVTIERAEDFKPALEAAIKANRPVLLDVRMVNIPTPTEGHWDIMSVFSPGKTIHHVSTT